MTTRVLASPSLAFDDIKNDLRDQGITWDSACHVTATGSLATALRGVGTPAIPIATMMDLATLPHWEHDGSPPAFPERDVLAARDEKAFREATKDWRRFADRLKFRLDFDLSRALRSHAQDVMSWSDHARLLVSGRQEFFRTVQNLEASGFGPTDLSARTAFEQSALDTWSALGPRVPNLSKNRDLLWRFDRQEALATAQTELARIFGERESGEPLQVLLHGFYFFTAPQWALFQLLGGSSDIDQIILVHDDGEHPAYATWRQFFSDNDWRLPTVQALSATAGIRPRADALRRALTGHPLREYDTDGVSVTRYRNVAEFAAEFLPDTLEARVYAPDHSNMNSYAARLSRPGDDEALDIGDLPIGVYILNLHSLVELRPGSRPRIRLTTEALRDIVSSGYLPGTGLDGGQALLGALDRAAPFFEGCDLGHEWVERAAALARLIRSDVSEFGARAANATDAERIAVHAANPLRTVPWTDLTSEDADALWRSIEAVVESARRIAEVERIEMGEYLGDLRKRLRQGMDHLTHEESETLLSKLDSAGELDDEMVGVDEVVEVVRLLLGRSVRRADPAPDEDDRGNEDGELDDKVAPLRDLDVLAYFPSRNPIHLANLSDKSFPRSARAVGWPFSVACLRPNDDPQRIALQIMAARESQAGLSDTYLLHLALGAAAEDGAAQTVRLSYVEQISRRPLNLAPLVAALTNPLRDHDDATVRNYLGGLAPGRNNPLAATGTSFPAVTVEHRLDATAALLPLDRSALATAVICRRRFAIQWALGPTASYRHRHHFVMIFGNATRGLRWLRIDHARAAAICDDLWRFVTRGQRSSSESKARTNPSNVKAWLATLGSYTGDYARAYRFAKGDDDIDVQLVSAADDQRVLPEGVHDPDICRHCPVKDRCLDAALH